MNSKIKMMIVDDDELYGTLTRKMITNNSTIELLTISKNGAEAINYLSAHAGEPLLLPDVILLDISMPVMDGWQFMNEYRTLKDRLGKKIIIHIVTSSISPSDLNRVKDYSDISDYIVKPLSKEKLMEIVS